MAIAIDKLHDFIRGTIKKNYGGFISPADIDRAINRAYMQQYGVGTDDTGRMTGGLFAGKNAPGTSAFGSANIYDMANKWHKKYGGMNYKTKEQQEKQKKIANIVKSQQTGGNNGGNNNISCWYRIS